MLMSTDKEERGTAKMYLDIYFLVNWVFNLFLLSVTAMHDWVSKKRLAGGAALGALGASAAEVLFRSHRIFPFIRPVISLLLAVLMVLVVWNKGGRQIWGRRLFRLYGYSFLMAGLLPVLQSYTKIWLLSVLLSYGGLRLWAWQQSRRRNNLMSELRITADGHTWTLKALVDSGNVLKEPIYGRPVIIAQAGRLPERPPACWPILYRTVGNEGLLLGFWPEKVETGKRSYGKQQVMVAITDNWKEEAYEAIVPAELLEMGD